MECAISYRCLYIVSVLQLAGLAFNEQHIRLSHRAEGNHVIAIPKWPFYYRPPQRLRKSNSLLRQILLDHWTLAASHRSYLG